MSNLSKMLESAVSGVDKQVSDAVDSSLKTGSSTKLPYSKELEAAVRRHPERKSGDHLMHYGSRGDEWWSISLENVSAAPSAEPVDYSSSQTLVEYAVQSVMNGKSVELSVANVVKKFDGSTNMFVGPGVIKIDSNKLEDAVWERFVDYAVGLIKGGRSTDPNGAVQATALRWGQTNKLLVANKKFVTELKKRIVKLMGRNPFPRA